MNFKVFPKEPKGTELIYEITVGVLRLALLENPSNFNLMAFKILHEYPNAKAGNNQYHNYYKMFLCFYQNGAFEFLCNPIGLIEF